MTRPCYDLVFVGNVAFDEIHPFCGKTHTLFGSAVYFAAMAASWSDKKIAMVARMAQQDAYLLAPMRKTGIAVHVSPSAETTRHRAVHRTENIDDREVFQVKSAGFFTMADMPDMEPTSVHLAGVTDEDFTMDFIQELRGRGFSCSVDMQGFVRRVDRDKGTVSFADVAAKQRIAAMAERVKLDVVEAEYLYRDRRLGGGGKTVREVGHLGDHGDSSRMGFGPPSGEELLRTIHQSERRRQDRAGRHGVRSLSCPPDGSRGSGLAEVRRRFGVDEDGDSRTVHGAGGAGRRRMKIDCE